MIKVVIDTNVIVSAHIKNEGAEARLLDLIANRKLRLYVSAPILNEYEGVLLRPKLRLDPERVQASLDLIRTVSTLLAPPHTLTVSSDEPDNRFLECAEAAEAQYLITGNKRHFPKRWKTAQVMNAREFLELISPELKG